MAILHQEEYINYNVDKHLAMNKVVLYQGLKKILVGISQIQSLCLQLGILQICRRCCRSPEK